MPGSGTPHGTTGKRITFIALHRTPSQSNTLSLAMWDYTVLIAAVPPSKSEQNRHQLVRGTPFLFPTSVDSLDVFDSQCHWLHSAFGVTSRHAAPARQAGSRLTHLGGMEGSVYLDDSFPRWFTCLQTVTHPSSSRARCRATSLIETNALTTTAGSHLNTS